MGKRRREKKHRITDISKKRQTVTTITQNTPCSGNDSRGKTCVISGEQRTFEEDSSKSDIKAIKEIGSGINLSWKEHIILAGIGAGITMVVYLISFLV